MPALTEREATEKIVLAVESMEADDLLDFYNEVFPMVRKAELDPSSTGEADRQKILEYIRRGLAIEEILDLWNVAFPGSYNVHFDDEDRAIHYSESTEAIRPFE